MKWHGQDCEKALYYGTFIGCPICNLRVFLKWLVAIARVARKEGKK